jgi:AraC-like DNA-binding protein
MYNSAMTEDIVLFRDADTRNQEFHIEMAGKSSSQLTRLFKRRYEKTLHDYFLGIKMARAKTLRQGHDEGGGTAASLVVSRILLGQIIPRE